MADEPLFEKSFNISGGDFVNAGEVASKVKKILQDLGFRTESSAGRRSPPMKRR